MTHEQIENVIVEARREDGTFDFEFIKQMNDQGIWFSFLDSGIRWSYTPF